MNQKIEKNQNKSEEVSKAKAVGFIRTRRAVSYIESIVGDMERILKKADVELVDIVIDREGSRSMDRRAMDMLYDWLEEWDVEVIIVKSLKDITDNKEDMKMFLDDLKYQRIMLICLEGAKVIAPFLNKKETGDQ